MYIYKVRTAIDRRRKRDGRAERSKMKSSLAWFLLLHPQSHVCATGKSCVWRTWVESRAQTIESVAGRVWCETQSHEEKALNPQREGKRVLLKIPSKTSAELWSHRLHLTANGAFWDHRAWTTVRLHARALPLSLCAHSVTRNFFKFHNGLFLQRFRNPVVGSSWHVSSAWWVNLGCSATL